MWRFLIRDKKFIIGLLFLVTLVALSIGNTIFNDGEIRKVILSYDEDGMVQVPPYPPFSDFILGSDQNGRDLLHVVIEGAKWTIGATVVIALARIVFGLIFAMIISFFVKKGYDYLESWFDSFSILPMTMIAYFLLANVLVFDSGDTSAPSFSVRLSFEILILTILAVPTVSFYIANETKRLLREEYVQTSRMLGGNTKHVIIKHIIPQLFPVLIIVFMQQFVQTLILLAHLGVLKLFLGGTVVFTDLNGKEFYTASHEWSGMLGLYYQQLMAYPWIPFVPMLFFALTIIAGNFILSGIQKAYEGIRKPVSKVKKKIPALDDMPAAKKDSFVFVERKDSMSI
ncbi:ABC transporter permease [Fictibacillus aquaticus]|uniref:Peptide ABC transporter permease n=1 Tax=Fictibacillus aquaticus TaxID=2021314 RepID=A0A235F8L6_9BACL|nr:ABC transporter permease subunit [Fictibacillus aquaticus]OYD57383.1 peptide ABC transporter permease [Fictibacillus aquaticus]